MKTYERDPWYPDTCPPPAAEKQRKTHDENGHQLVTVDDRYAYRWLGSEPLKIGDKVVCPGSWWNPDSRVGKVTALYSEWDDDHVNLQGLAE